MTTSPAAYRVRTRRRRGAALDQLLTDLQPVELVRSYRSGTHENSHYGSLVILDRDGSPILQRGDVHRPVFHRSCAKPFQAVAMLELNAPLAGADLALAAASHTGEPEHVHRTLGILDRSGFTEDDLGCPAALPSDPAAYRSVIRGNGEQRRVYMNCSGKHAAMLATCRVQSWPSAGYLDVDHPLQQRIRAVIETATGEVPAGVGVDGCGAPVYATSLVALARGFGAVASADRFGRTPGGRRHAGSPGHGRRHRGRRHPPDAGDRRPAGQGRRRRRALRRAARRAQHRPEDRRRRRSGPDAGAGRRPCGRWDSAPAAGAARDLLDELAVGTVLGGGQPVGTVEIVPGLLS